MMEAEETNQQWSAARCEERRASADVSPPVTLGVYSRCRRAEVHRAVRCVL